MLCYFLRHGEAVEADEWDGSDFDRPLTRKGHTLMEREAKTIDALGFKINLIVSSPLARAKQTAVIVAKRLKLEDRIVEDQRLGPGFGPSQLAELLAEHTVDAIMLVGHEPDLSRTVGQVVGGTNVELKKGSLACVDVASIASSQGTLVALLPAKVLALR